MCRVRLQNTNAMSRCLPPPQQPQDDDDDDDLYSAMSTSQCNYYKSATSPSGLSFVQQQMDPKMHETVENLI